MRYTIIVKENFEIEKTINDNWVKGGDGDPNKFGYAPPITKTTVAERDIFMQKTNELDLIALIKAIN